MRKVMNIGACYAPCVAKAPEQPGVTLKLSHVVIG